MNEFVAKKLGEVLAFSVVGLETIDRAKPGLVQIWDNDQIKALVDAFSAQRDGVIAAADEAKVTDATSTKAEATGTKLKGMRDAYIGDEWDNPAEVLEWLGFFEGSAMVHWALVKGAAQGLNRPELLEQAESAINFHHDFLYQVRDQLQAVGQERATKR